MYGIFQCNFIVSYTYLEQLILDKQTTNCCHCVSGYVRVSSAGVDREVADSLRIVIRAGPEDCGVNTTIGDGNQSKISCSVTFSYSSHPDETNANTNE